MIKIGGHTLYFEGDLTVTVLPDGKEVHAAPQDNDEYRARARELGYGDDTAAMSREHEICHALLAHWCKLPESPTLRGVVTGSYYKHWRAEEATVLNLQAFIRSAGIDIMELVP